LFINGHAGEVGLDHIDLFGYGDDAAQQKVSYSKIMFTFAGNTSIVLVTVTQLAADNVWFS
jgi:hypothetical protein